NIYRRYTMSTTLPPSDPTLEARKPEPPPGVPLYYEDQRHRACARNQAFYWTWAGAGQWYSVVDHPLPPEQKPTVNSETNLPESRERRSQNGKRGALEEVSVSTPCPVCSGDHACKLTENGLIICVRQQGEVAGFRCVGERDEWGLYRRSGDPVQ